MSKIEPKILKGFRDFLPEKQIARQKMIDTIKASFESFGFEPLETPVLEYAEILTGKYGDEGDKLMYRFRDNGDRDVAMRYDLTIPLARVVAMNGELKKPFKRYQISPVWRADNPQKGRYREFYQCDADIAGSTSPLADAEILALAANTLSKLGLDTNDFVIRVNSREIISTFYESLKLSPEQKIAAIRAVDKIEKIGREGVEKELLEGGFSKEIVDQLLGFAEMRIDDVEDIGAALKAFPILADSLNVLVDIVKKALMLVPGAQFALDLSIARGLDYYTGIIFETTPLKAPQFSSILSGGRYDNLVGTFANKPVPAIGLSIGLDRLIAFFEEVGMMKSQKTTAKVLIVNFDESLTPTYLSLASTLRSAGVNTFLYFESADMKKQLSYASDKGIAYALLYGTNEAKENKIIIKNLDKGTQEKIDFDKAASYFS